MLAVSPLRRLTPDRARPATLAAGAAASCAILALVDPSGDAPYPVCPTRALLGVDCPACGTLRGLHAASRGQLGAALSHNVLLAVAIPVGALIWLRWVTAGLGRQVRPIALPRWVVPAVVTVAVAFAVARNLPIDGLAWLDSA